MNFATFSDRHLLAMHRVAKTRLYAFFRDPKHMIALRTEILNRGLTLE